MASVRIDITQEALGERERGAAFFLSHSPATFSKALADNGRLREEVQEVALEQRWSGGVWRAAPRARRRSGNRYNKTAFFMEDEDQTSRICLQPHFKETVGGQERKRRVGLGGKR